MHAVTLLLSALLPGADSGTAAHHPAPVQTIDLATLTPLTARPGLPAMLPLARALGVPVERFAEGVEDPAEE